MKKAPAILISLLFIALSLTPLLATSPKDNLVEVCTLCPTIKLDIRYATTNNFTGKQVYESARCFLCASTAQKIAAVQAELATMGLGLKIWDGYRPLSVQKIFWKLIPDERYVANPSKGSRHNRGTAVDCTLIDNQGNELEMPSLFDDFSEKASRNYKTMTPTAAKNCNLLETIMAKHGFSFIYSEWWHFDDLNWEKYELLDIPFAQL